MGGSTTISTSDTKLEALNIQSSAYGVTIPLVYGVNRIAGNMIWFGAFTATAHTTSTPQGGGGKGGGGVTTQNTTYTYSASIMLGLCEGPITATPRIWRGKELFTDGATTALAQLGISLAAGNIGQSTWSYLATNYPAQALAYSGLAVAYASAYDLGSNAQVANHSFEVIGQQAYAISGTVKDANPATVAVDVLTNVRYGAGFPVAQIASITEWSNYCIASGLLLSPAIETQVQAGEFVTQIGKLTNTAPVWTSAGLKMVPYGDETLTGNGVTFVPM